MARESTNLGTATVRGAFVHYLRTGRRVWPDPLAPGAAVERKFNPWHDDRDGRFTFGPGGSAGAAGGGRRTGGRIMGGGIAPRGRIGPDGSLATPAATLSDGVYRPMGRAATLVPAQFGRPPRTGIGGNSGAFRDPMTLQQVFPNLSRAPAGSILALADHALDLTGPASRLTTELSQAHVTRLVAQIKALDPSFHFDSFGLPATTDGQARQIDDLRMARAAAFYRRGEIRPLQVETMRFLQRSVDRHYEEGLHHGKEGRPEIRLSDQEALGNYIDRAARRDLQKAYSGLRIATDAGQPVRVNRRAYDTSGTEVTYRIPDVRIGKIAMDVTLTRKDFSTKQIIGFFQVDFKPDAVVIIRPSRSGINMSYLMTRGNHSK